MFDLAYTLESYDLVPTTEGIVSKIGKGIKAVIDFVIKKFKGAIAFLKGKKKEIGNTEAKSGTSRVKKLSENKDRIPKNYKINRENSAKTKRPTLHENTISIMQFDLVHMAESSSNMIDTLSKLIKEQNSGNNTEYIEKIMSSIDEIDDVADHNILPTCRRIDSSTNKSIADDNPFIDTWISRLQGDYDRWLEIQKNGSNKEFSDEVNQIISKVATSQTKVLNTIIKVTNTMSKTRNQDFNEYALYNKKKWYYERMKGE